MATTQSTFAFQSSNLRAFLTHFGVRRARVVEFVKTFGVSAASRRAWIVIRQFHKSILMYPQLDKPSVIIRAGGPEHQAEMYEDVRVSVVIPVKDAGDDFKLLLSSLTTQKGFEKIEIIVVDSGSADRSVETAQEFGGKVLHIPPEEFSHSHARNLAAEHAAGDYILFTVQDALPSSDLWLLELFSALRHNGVAAVSCAEYPREDADLFYRVLCWGHHQFLEVIKRDRILSKPEIEDYVSLRKNAQLSNVACFMPKKLFLEYKFRGNFAEDLELGLRLIGDGHQLVMLSSTRVIHSHNRPAYYHLKRGYSDILFLCKIFRDHPIVALEYNCLLREILYVRDLIDSLVEHLTTIGVGCRVGHLSRLLMKYYRSFKKGNQRVMVAGYTNGYMDERFELFLANIRKRLGSYSRCGLDYKGALMWSMEGATNTMLDYMEESYDTVDENLLDDFRSALYKMFAHQVGSHLAACYAKGSEETKKNLETLNRELTQGI